MEPIRLNHNYRKVKFVLLALMITMGTEAKEILEGATDYFELLKGGIIAVIFFVAIFIYVYTEQKLETDDEDEDQGENNNEEITSEVEESSEPS